MAAAVGELARRSIRGRRAAFVTRRLAQGRLAAALASRLPRRRARDAGA
ncbi:hypothetical protein [Sorangium sp. So ce693]